MRGVNTSYKFTSQTSIGKPDWTVPFKQEQVETVDRPVLAYDKEKMVYLPRSGTRSGARAPSRDGVGGAALADSKGRPREALRTANDVMSSKVPL
mmetsp:Transcript_7789/g.22024  ORF Transcript_7789/g.22024 Transcript_7789/m.22024 type:complete len:95 (-) Transcript_7789:92-376(-)